MKKYVKRIPEFIYLIAEGGWFAGPFVHPQKGRQNRKFKLIEVTENEETKKEEVPLKENTVCEGCKTQVPEDGSVFCFYCKNNS
jgi:hypothetical protein